MEKGTTKTVFLSRIVKDGIRILFKEPQEIECLYNGYRMLVENQMRNTPEREKECRECLEIIEKVQKMFTNTQMIDIIIKNNMTDKQFISKYGERILGLDKRRYDMSNKFNSNLILPQDQTRKERKIQYQLSGGKIYVYHDAEGKTITIQKIGELTFKQWNGLEDRIIRYIVKREIGNNVYQMDKIFSRINMTLMNDPRYRQVVLEELLSRRNIQLSRAGGYVGEIENVKKEDNDFKEGSEKVVEGDYYYRINRNYMLAYHSEVVTAAILQSMKEKGKEEAR